MRWEAGEEDGGTNSGGDRERKREVGEGTSWRAALCDYRGSVEEANPMNCAHGAKSWEDGVEPVMRCAKEVLWEGGGGGGGGGAKEEEVGMGRVERRVR